VRLSLATVNLLSPRNVSATTITGERLLAVTRSVTAYKFLIFRNDSRKLGDAAGGYNPHHQDTGFAAKEGFYRRLTIPGFLAGSMLTHIVEASEIPATEMRFEYLVPVFLDDRITCASTVLGSP